MKPLLLIETVIAIALTFIYWLRPDSLSALTILPAWTWLLLAAPVVPFLRRHYLKYSIIFISAWFLFLIIHVEELRSVARGLINPATEQKPPGALRLVTMNCGGGQPATLNELKMFDPDIIFLQESPPQSNVEASAHEMFGPEGDCLYNADTSILVRGKLTNVKQGDPRLFYSHATVTFSGTKQIDLVSLRLPTGNVRTDLWNPTCWTIHRQHRRSQLNQIQQIVKELHTSHSLFVAGDFNAPQGDKIFSVLPSILYDTFSSAGKGIGNTILNDIPVLRIDQIWVSQNFETLQSFARQSKASDHRIVVSDVKRKGNTQPAPPDDSEPGNAHRSKQSF
jgi:vancomycin resistance protein VanJ